MVNLEKFRGFTGEELKFIRNEKLINLLFGVMLGILLMYVIRFL